MIDPAARVHASAELEDGVTVGAGSAIWQRAQVRTGARIGAECVIGRDVFIDQGVEIGDRVKIQNGALVYHGVTVADGVFIGPGAILTNDRYPRSITAEGELARAEDWQVSPIRLEHGSSIGAGAIVVAGCDVGPFAMVGAGAVVTRTVPGHALVAGQPREADRLGLCLRRPAHGFRGTSRAGRDRALHDRSGAHLRTLRPPLRLRTHGRHAPRGDAVIPVARPDIDDAEIAAVTEVLRSGMLAGGRRVAELEERWAAFIGVRHAIAVSNGTVAEMCIFAGLGLEPGDEVITVGHTFNATVSSILYAGATPVFVDIDPETYDIDPDRVAAAITPRTKAICPVHLFGLPADMDPLLELADRHGLAIVEDACQAHGAEYRGRRVGSFGHGAFSLYGTKNMTTGEGGLITTDDDALADWIRLYRNQGMRERYRHEILGYNFRLTDIAAAIGLCQLDKLERNTARRQAIATRYDEAFADVPVVVPSVPADRTHVYHQYTLDVGPARDAIVADLAAAGVSTGIYYPIPVHRQPYVLALGIRADLPVTDRAAARSLSLPMFPGLTDAEQATVIEAVRAVVGRHAATAER